MRRRSITAIAAACVMAAAAAAPAMAAAPSLEARLKAVEDHIAIETLLQGYTVAIDAGDWRGYADVFARDGELHWLGQTMKGRDAIFKRISAVVLAAPRSRGAPPPAGQARSAQKHILSNLRIVVNGDRATATARWTLVMQGPQGEAVLDSTGPYTDTLIREDGQWKVARRVIGGDIPLTN